MAGARMHHPTAQAHAVLMVAADPSRFADEAAKAVASSVAIVCEGGEAGARDRKALETRVKLVGLGPLGHNGITAPT